MLSLCYVAQSAFADDGASSSRMRFMSHNWSATKQRWC